MTIRGPDHPGTLRRRRFILAYLRCGNAAKAYQEAGFKCKDYSVASACAWKMLQRPEVQAMLREAAARATAELEVTEASIRHEIAGIGFSTPDDPPKPADKLRALEILAKIHQLYKDAPPPPQWNLDPATLATMSTEDLETALKHAERVQDLLTGKKPDPSP